jgi:LPS sulfotransferase NodH
MTSSLHADTGRKRYDLASAEHDYAPWVGPPRRKILLCSQPRSGSTLVGEALYFASGLGCPLEYYHIGFRPDFEARWRTPDPTAYAMEVQRRRTDPGGTFSAKLFWRDVEAMVGERDPALLAQIKGVAPTDTSPATYQAIAGLLDDLVGGAEFIHLYRRDRVRLAVSSLKAIQTGVWRTIPGVDERAPLQEAQYDFDRIAGFIANADYCHGHWRNFLASMGKQPWTLTYEDIARDYSGTIGALLRHLGCEAGAPPVRMHRQSDARSEALALRFLREAQSRLS